MKAFSARIIHVTKKLLLGDTVSFPLSLSLSLCFLKQTGVENLVVKCRIKSVLA